MSEKERRDTSMTRDGKIISQLQHTNVTLGFSADKPLPKSPHFTETRSKRSSKELFIMALCKTPQLISGFDTTKAGLYCGITIVW